MSSQSQQRRDVLVVGNYCHDVLVHGPGRETHALGGSSAYIASVLDAVGVDYAVVSVVGEDFRYGDQVRQAPRMVPGSRTTRFTADFTRGERVLSVGARAAPILPELISEEAHVALACGVVDELLPETLVRLSERAEQVVADGRQDRYIRKYDPENHVKTHLIVSRAGTSMGHVVGIDLLGIFGYGQSLKHSLCTH